MTLCVLYDRSRRVKAHGLGIEQGASKLGMIMAFEPSRRIGDEGKAGGMAFRKAVLAKAANLLKYPLGKLRIRSPSLACV